MDSSDSVDSLSVSKGGRIFLLTLPDLGRARLLTVRHRGWCSPGLL